MIVVHLGAHRTGTTLFQRTLHDNKERLRDAGVRYLGPEQTRQGLFDGLMKRKQHFEDVELTQAAQCASNLAQTLDDELFAENHVFLSDENIIGSMRRNILAQRMYPDIRQTLRLLEPAFRKVGAFYITIRPLEEWWNSCFAYAIRRFLSPPTENDLEHIAANTQGWRFLIEALIDTFPSAEIRVAEFGRLTGDVRSQLIAVTGWSGLPFLEQRYLYKNRSFPIEQLATVLEKRGDQAGARRLKGSEHRLDLFSGHASAILNECYQNDLRWLHQAAGSRVTFVT